MLFAFDIARRFASQIGIVGPALAFAHGVKQGAVDSLGRLLLLETRPSFRPLARCHIPESLCCVLTLRSGRSWDRPTPARPTWRSSGCAVICLGVIGFPGRLLAREVYDRVVAIKGEKQVALLTGEERIVPAPGALFPVHGRILLPPVGNEGERGAISPSRQSTRHSSGSFSSAVTSSPTGCSAPAAARKRSPPASDTLKPVVREIPARGRDHRPPRFSTLRYAGGVKLSRLLLRSAVVAFSA